MRNLRRLIPYLCPQRKALVLASVAMVLNGALSAVFLFLAQHVLQPMLSSHEPNRVAKLDYFTAVVAVVAVFRALTDFGQDYLTQRTGQRILAQLRLDVFSHFQSLSIAFLEHRRTGDIISRLTNDLNSLQVVLTIAVITAVSAPIEVLGALGFMVYSNWRLSLFVLVILPPVALLINRAGRQVKAAAVNLQAQLGTLVDYLQEKISAMRLIQTFGTRDYEIRLFEQVNREAYVRTMRPIKIRSVLGPAIEFTGTMGVLLSLWFGGRDVIHGKMDAAALIVFLLAVNRVAMRAKALASLNLYLSQADAAAGRLLEVMDTVPDIKDVPNAHQLKRDEVHGHLVFDQVRFTYNQGPAVLHSISFEIRPGEVVALAGLSGSGKSTIAALVPRLYDPTGGRVTVDGHDLREVSLQSLRAQIGAVPQETTLFDGTIRDNIAYGRPDASEAEIVEAARRANADDFIRLQPNGYDTQIGEHGGRLSGGQRQRIAVARALLRDPRILILDEATSSLDAESESLVQDALGHLMEGRTTLIIAHRFSTILHADRILVLDQGRIIESGTHEELLAHRGLYYRLYQMQAFQAQEELASEAGESDGAAVRAEPAVAVLDDSSALLGDGLLSPSLSGLV